MKFIKLLIPVFLITLFFYGCSSDSLSELSQTRWTGEMTFENKEYTIDLFFVKEKSGTATIVNKITSNSDYFEFAYKKEGNVLVIGTNNIDLLRGNWLITKLNQKELVFDQKAGAVYNKVSVRRAE